MVKVMSDELPIGRLLERVAPNIHDSIFDEYGRFAPFWRWSRPKEEESVALEKIEIVPALPAPRPIVTTREVIPIEKPKPEIMPEF